MFHVYKIKLSLTSCIAPHIPYQVTILAQNSNPVPGEVNSASAIAFSREGSEFFLSSISQSLCICIIYLHHNTEIFIAHTVSVQYRAR